VAEELGVATSPDTPAVVSAARREARPAMRGGPQEDARLRPDDRRTLRLAWAIGAVPVMVAFAWLLTAGSWNPLQGAYFDDFFDHQGRAFLDGRWDVPRWAVGFEGFQNDGKTYIYFGPWPALLRLPVLAVTDRFDGQLTVLSMTLAMTVLGVSAHRLSTTMREVVRGPAPVTRREAVGTAALAMAVLAGPALWLGSGAVVYHEATLWGLAFAVAAYDAVARWLMRPTTARLVAVGLLAAGVLLSRQSIGVGVLAGLVLVTIATDRRLAVWRRLRPAPAAPDPARARGDGGHPAGGEAPDEAPPAGATGAVGTVRLVAMCAGLAVVSVIPNLARFGTLIHPSIESQVASDVFEDRREFLEANDGAIFGPQFVPTTLLQYLRPDAFDFRAQFPWIDYPRAGPHVVGDVTFDDLEWTSSVPVTMPALVVLAVPGAGWIIRQARRRGYAWLGPLWVGSLAGGLGAVTIGYVAHRYLADLVPIVLLPALVGAHVIADRAPARRSGRRRARLAALGLLAAFGYWANVGLAIEHQHERGKVVLEERRAQLVLWRTSLPGPRAPVVRVERDYPFLPPRSGDGTLAVAGDCDGLYVRVGDDWRGVSRGPGAGVFDLRVDLDALGSLPVGHRAPLLALGNGADASTVAITRLQSGMVRVDVSGPRVRNWAAGRPAELAGETTIRVVADPRAVDRNVMADRTVLNTAPIGNFAERASVGGIGRAEPDPGPLVARYPGDIELLPFDRDVCRDATGR
jgi:hypothetical protein